MSEEIDTLRQQLDNCKQFMRRWIECSIEADAVIHHATAYALTQLDELPVEQRTTRTLLSLLLDRGKHCAQDISQQGHDQVQAQLGLLERHVRDLQQPPDLADTLEPPKG